jgi:hydroxypyruvate reductase
LTVPPAHALLRRCHAAAVAGVAPAPRTREHVAAWLARRMSNAPVHLLALGKAAVDMTSGAIDALHAAGQTPAHGLVVSAHKPEPLPAWTDRLALRVGDHPSPDIGSLAAADAIASAIAQVDAGDDVLVLLSGGTTALCAAPCAELSAAVGHPADAQRAIADAVQTMLARGLAIHEMNTIRRRLLRWGGGRLATALAARGVREIVVFAISDVIGDDPAVIGSGPCTPDPCAPDDVLALCDAYGLRAHLDAPLLRALGLAGSGASTITPPSPSHPAFARVTHTVIARNADACETAAAAARAERIACVAVADEVLEGDAAALGTAIARVALRHAMSEPAESLLVWGGEPTVVLTEDEDEDALDDDVGSLDDPMAPILRLSARATLAADPPLGGRMQALALAAALALESPEALVPFGVLDDARRHAARITVLAAGTDGRDGPTHAAGAIVDAITAPLVRRAGRDPDVDLRRHRSYHALDGADALLRTGPTGTNVMDLVLVHIRAT